jgi:hypothetical protein
MVGLTEWAIEAEFINRAATTTRLALNVFIGFP